MYLRRLLGVFSMVNFSGECDSECSCFKRFEVGGTASLVDHLYHHFVMKTRQTIVVEIPNAENCDPRTKGLFGTEVYKGHDFYMFSFGGVCMRDKDFEYSDRIAKTRYILGVPSRKEDQPEGGTIFYDSAVYIWLDAFVPAKLERIIDREKKVLKC